MCSGSMMLPSASDAFVADCRRVYDVTDDWRTAQLRYAGTRPPSRGRGCSLTLREDDGL